MLGVIGDRFSIGKETYQPFAVELHYFRIEKRYWSICFERIKRAGYRILTTSVPWNIHQADNKEFDFNGFTDPRKDLIVFLELAREFGFKVILRPGPWLSGQLENGGLPSYLFNDIKIHARDAKGQERQLPDDYGVRSGYLPSYLHKNFQYYLRDYFKALIETTKNYVHPRGPIFMVELDYETSFGRMLEPDSADYNPDVLSQYYPPFLMSRYEDIKKLNQLYKEKNESFESVEPPRQFTDLEAKDFPKVLDWFRFRQHILNTYLGQLEDFYTSYTVEPLIFRSLYFRRGDLLPAFNLVPDDRSPFLGSNVLPDGNYFDLCVKARFLRAEYGFAFAASFVSGRAAADPDRESRVAPIHDNTRRFYLAAALTAGFKGMNQHMFVDRDRWYGAPLHNDGTIADGYQTIRRFNTNLAELGLEDMTTQVPVAVVGNRMYSWIALTDSEKVFPQIRRLLYDSTAGFCRDLMRLKLQFGIRENRDWESMDKYQMVFVASTEVMSERDQEAIVELSKKGVTIIMCGLMPRMDDQFRDCSVLANHFRIKTVADYRIANVEYRDGTFPTYIYGQIKSVDDSKCKKLIKSEAKILGVCTSRFKGNLYFFTFDIASGGNHHKLAFIESLLAGEKLVPYLYCSDPAVDVAFYHKDKRGLLTVVAPPAGELSDGLEAAKREVIVRAELRDTGFKGAKLKLTSLFDDPEDPKPIRLTTKELRDGIPLTVEYPDGLAFIVDKY